MSMRTKTTHRPAGSDDTVSNRAAPSDTAPDTSPDDTSPGPSLQQRDLSATTLDDVSVADAGRSPTMAQPGTMARPSTMVQPSPTPNRRASSTGPSIGTRIGHYEIVRSLGQGGMGMVFLARDTKLARKVAIKFLKSQNQQLAARFLIEARATAQCRHENIVVIYEVDEHEGMPFMVLEYLRGQTLSKLISGQPLPASRAVELIVPVVRALACAHELDIVHRDLKPDNIIITYSGAIKVLDFGIAKVLEQDQHNRAGAAPRRPPSEPIHGVREAPISTAELIGAGKLSNTRTGSLIGTVPYMSPEQWGQDDVDHRTDVWAVGIMLYEMLTGKHPLAPMEGIELAVTASPDEPMPSAHDADTDIPGELADIIDLCLCKRKEERMASAGALLEALEPLTPGRDRRTLSEAECPYLGLSAFQESDADRFYGRSHEIAGMTNRLRSQPLVGVVGASGVGKSSFVRAGVIPALKSSGERWETFVVRPGRHPLTALAQVVVPFVTGESAGVTLHMREQEALACRLSGEPGYLGTLLRNRAREEGLQDHLVRRSARRALYPGARRGRAQGVYHLPGRSCR